MNTLREEVKQADQQNKLKTAPKPSYGYGGKFGVERDRMDKSAVGHDHVEVVEKHASQKDHKLGFGGKFGVQADRQDKSAVGWDHREQTAAHPSQTDYAKGFGGKYGVQTDRMDTTAGADQSKDTMQLHPSQMRPEVRGQAGGISALRSQFEYKGQTAASPASCGPTAAQIRMSEERARWEAERSKAAANAPPSPPEPQPTHEPQRASVQEPTPEVYPESEQEPAVETTTYPAEHVDQPTHEPQRASVQEPTPEVYPESEQEPAVETTTYPTEHVDQVSELSGSDALTQCTVVALYDYTAEEADELTFSVGELITEVELKDSGWWKGVCRDKVGLFPSNYVQEQ
ncbi:hypothetical protein T265_02396 [Opisthorchis viverrini]|uniref:SH3 domain-containing protein n=1 Tax=Opisthorchis viverrini TaxID=6198 RepID=A0A075AIB5_OPIVI|nr:hypothetical protein T265_02396 [Opisthorchis viverrini]KER31344.1 hypothetical protein T265_02396 [Opisthorchis viverrini]